MACLRRSQKLVALDWVLAAAGPPLGVLVMAL
jgi:hypothetical protein